MCHVQARDAPGGIITARGAALLRPPVTRARVTVTGLVMAATMTATGAARVTSSAAPTTASSLAPTTTPRTTAARGLRACLWLAVRAQHTIPDSLPAHLIPPRHRARMAEAKNVNGEEEQVNGQSNGVNGSNEEAGELAV